MSQETVGSPIEWTTDVVSSSWSTIKSVYWANSPSWRFLKSGALVFLGFFLWMGGNLVLSYQSAWTWLYYPMAYGFVLVPWGPFHHAVVIPLAIRFRKQGKMLLGKRLPNVSLAAFLVVVAVLGTVPAAAGPMVFDFGSALEDTTGTDINPDLLCTKSATDGEQIIHCHLTTSEGIDHVDVQSGGETVVVDRQPPFDFTISSRNLTEVTGQKQFQVVLRDGDGNMIRRYIRTLSMVEEGGEVHSLGY